MMDTPPIPPSATRLAAPFSPPPAFKPPPEPSLWPLLLLGLFGLTCLGGCAGFLIVGTSWLHGKLSATNAKEIAEASPAVKPPIVQNPPVPPQGVQDNPRALLPPGIDPPEPLEVRKIQEEIRQAMRRMEEQFAREIRPAPPAPDFGPPPPELPEDFSPQPPIPQPQSSELTPLPDLGKPPQELPLLEFGPMDLQPLGRRIRGDHRFQDIAPAGGWLVGFRVTKGKPWDGAIVALQPIYQVSGEYHLGQPCGSGQQALEHVQYLAKPGYAIGKIEARIGLIMNALRIEFQRVDGGSLNSTEAYSTDWFGADGGSPQTFDGRGSPLVGVSGSFQPDGEVITIQLLRKTP